MGDGDCQWNLGPGGDNRHANMRRFGFIYNILAIGSDSIKIVANKLDSIGKPLKNVFTFIDFGFINN